MFCKKEKKKFHILLFYVVLGLSLLEDTVSQHPNLNLCYNGKQVKKESYLTIVKLLSLIGLMQFFYFIDKFHNPIA